MTTSGRFVALLLVVVLAVVGVVVVRRASNSNSQSSQATSQPAARAAATSALYLSDGTLSRLDLDSGAARVIGRTPTDDVHASQSSPWVVYVVSGEGEDGGEDFLAAPVLRAINIETGATTNIGPGFNPLWHPTETRLAYLRPTVKRQCSGEHCDGLSEIVVYDPETEASSPLTEAGRFNLLAWSGQRVLAADETDLSVTLSLRSKEDVERLDLEPSELWDASPDGRWLVRTTSDNAVLVDLGGGPERTLPVGDGILAEGTWSPDSKHILAGLLNEARTKTSALLIDIPDGDVQEITDELPGILDVTWTPDGSQFAFLTFVNRSNRTALNLCSVAQGRCQLVGPPLQRAILMRLE
jgi:hypothetical protein